MIKTYGYGAQTPGSLLAPFTFERHDPTNHEIEIDVLFCGICHSDIHYIRNEWKNSNYPIVPGHEVIGHINALGSHAANFKVGDLVGVGPIIDSCRTCPSCTAFEEQYCTKRFTEIFNSTDIHGEITRGGYSTSVVVDERFVFKIPNYLAQQPLASLAPLFCAGITTYTPLAFHNIGRNNKVGIIGIGGLGHLAIKSAKALGAQVVAFTSTPWKKQDALALGADLVILTYDDSTMLTQLNSFDLIIDTLPVAHFLDPYLKLLKCDGTLCLVGIPGVFHPPFRIDDLIFGRKKITGSILGGTKTMQQFLKFCETHEITADVETIEITEVNKGFERILQRDVKYRLVIDMASLKK